MRPKPKTENVVNVFNQATPVQHATGVAWYHDAHGAAASLDPDRPDRAAGVIAALSPQTYWARNLELAARAYDQGFASGTLGRSCRVADAILSGADPLSVLSGPKVRAFYMLISNPDDAHTVCVDRHAVDVAIGERLTVAERERWYPLARRGWYERFAACYRAAAPHLGVSPAQVQAVTWVVWVDAWSGVRVGI
jgi:hypothetical protein